MTGLRMTLVASMTAISLAVASLAISSQAHAQHAGWGGHGGRGYVAAGPGGGRGYAARGGRYGYRGGGHRGGWGAGPLIAGAIGGLALGALAAGAYDNRGREEVYYEGYGATDYGGYACIAKTPVYDSLGNFMGYKRVRAVC